MSSFDILKYELYSIIERGGNINGLKNKDIDTWTGMFVKDEDLVSSYVVFDLETTGLDPLKDHIIEIGALKYQDNKLVDTFQVLVNPQIPIPELITNLTGINDEMVKNEQGIEIVIKDFINFVGDNPLVAHNGSFDLSFINANLIECGMDILNNKNIDTVGLARTYLPNLYNHKLTTIKNYFHLDYGSHRSLEDCMVTNYVYQYCLNESKKKNSQ